MSRLRPEPLLAAEARGRSHVSATQQGRTRIVPISDIRYFLADHKYVTAGYPGGEVLLDDSLRRLETEFGDRFLRVHRNALVAIAYVERLERDPSGGYYVRLRGMAASIAVSRRLLTIVKRRLGGIR